MRHRFALVLFAASAITVAGCGGTTGSNLFGGLATPTITSIAPNPVARGNSVTITGTGLNGTLTTANYNFALNGAFATSVAASSGTTTTAVVSLPATAGTYSVTVTVGDGLGNVSAASNAVTLTVN